MGGCGKTNGSVGVIPKTEKSYINKAYGFDDPGKTKPIRTDHIFRIASQTKAITVAVMILYEEGKFLLDDPVSKYIPEMEANRCSINSIWPTVSYKVPAKREVTIRQLLTHTSGIGYAQIGIKKPMPFFPKPE